MKTINKNVFVPNSATRFGHFRLNEHRTFGDAKTKRFEHFQFSRLLLWSGKRKRFLNWDQMRPIDFMLIIILFESWYCFDFNGFAVGHPKRIPFFGNFFFFVRPFYFSKFGLLFERIVPQKCCETKCATFQIWYQKTKDIIKSCHFK